MAGLFFLIGWFSVDHEWLPFLTAIRIAEGTARGLGLFGSLFVIILGTTGFLREFRPTYDFLWTRSFHVHDYLVGKFIGVCAGTATALLPVALWVAYLEIALYGFQGLIPQGTEWAFLLAVTLTSVLSATLLVGLILKRALWTVLLMIFVVGGLLALNLDVAYLSGFAPYGIYVSALIGYGPDSRLVMLHRTFYLELSLFVLTLSLFVIRLASPRLEKETTRLQGAAGGLLLTGMMIALFCTGMNFQRISNAISGEPTEEPILEKAQDCSMLRSYRVELTLDRETARVDGKAFLEVGSASAFMVLPLDLNEGLQISKVAASLQNVKTEVNENILSITLPREMEERNAVLTLEYFGTFHVPRHQYDNMYRSPERWLEPFWLGAYLDQETVFLLRNGNWHPLPACPMTSLEVKITGADSFAQVIHTADKAMSSPGQILLTWKTQPPLPLFIASQNYQTTRVGEAVLYSAPLYIPEKEADAVFFPYPVLMTQMETCLQEGKPSDFKEFRIALTPLIKNGYYDPSSGVFMLPENIIKFYPVLMDNTSISKSGPLNSPELLYPRWVAEHMLRLWWCGDSICPVMLDNDTFDDNRIKGQDTLHALLTYSALRMAEPLVGQDFVEAEIIMRQRLLEDQSLWLGLKIPEKFSLDTNRLVVQLHGLADRTGPELFCRLTREYRRLYGNASLSDGEFALFVERETGESFP